MHLTIEEALETVYMHRRGLLRGDGGQQAQSYFLTRWQYQSLRLWIPPCILIFPVQLHEVAIKILTLASFHVAKDKLKFYIKTN
jgi:hypothetical protein